jgi:hypothetical protein
MRAFAVTENFADQGAILFARHAIAACKAGADEYADGDLGSVTCKRAPWADEYVDKVVPASVMIRHGWHFECSHCGASITDSYLQDKDLPVDGVVGGQHGRVYCCAGHARSDERERRRRNKVEDAAIATFAKIVKRDFPDAVVVGRDSESMTSRPHAYAVGGSNRPWITEQVIVPFLFDGMAVGPATLRYERESHHRIGPFEPHYFCCNGDKAAFERFADGQRAKRMR